MKSIACVLGRLQESFTRRNIDGQDDDIGKSSSGFSAFDDQPPDDKISVLVKVASGEDAERLMQES